MPQTASTATIAQCAYDIAWKNFVEIRDFTSSESAKGPNQLRLYVNMLVVADQCDPVKIAASALGMVREYDQIARSRERLAIMKAEETDECPIL